MHFFLERVFADRFPSHLFFVVWRRNVDVVRWIPFFVIDAIEHAAKRVAAILNDAFEPMTKLRREDFGGHGSRR